MKIFKKIVFILLLNLLPINAQIICNDNNYSGNIYLAWNVRSNKGRIAGTGAYIAKLKIKIGVLGGDSQKKEVTRSWGIRRIKK